MAITTHDGTNHDGLFDILGKCFKALSVLDTATGATVPTPVLAILAQFNLLTPSTQNANDCQGIATGLTGWQASESTLTSAIQTAAQNILVTFVQADTATVDPGNLAANLEYLIAQMAASGTTGGDHVAANTPGSSGTAAPGGSNGDMAIYLTSLQGTGVTGQNVLAETIAFSDTDGAASSSPTIIASSPAAVSDRLNFAWPGGSGLNVSISATDPAASQLTNGTFEAQTIPGLPDGWIPITATPGTTLNVTSPYTQTVAISGTPTGGSYILKWTDQAGNARSTAPLAFNAQPSDVQTALANVPGLSGVSVTATGTTPNLTHTVAFNGLGGSVNALTATSFLTGGSPVITPGSITGGDPLSYLGSSLIIVGNGSELTTIVQPLPILTPDTNYFLHFRLLTDGVISGGVLKVSVVQAIGGSEVTDTAGNTSDLSLTLSGVTVDTWKAYGFSFRLSPAMPQPAYLQIKLTTALTSAKKVYLDNFALAQGTQLYSGGPSAAAFQGAAATQPAAAWSYAVTNTWSNSGAAGFQTWFNAAFGMMDLALALPTAGSTAISDGLIA